MRIPATAVIAVAALAIASAAGAAPPPTNAFNAQLRALDPLSKMASIRRAVTTSGGACTRVTDAHDDGLYGNLARWSVRCGTDGDYELFLGPGGEVQLRSCDEAKTLKLPACTLAPLPKAAGKPPRR